MGKKITIYESLFWNHHRFTVNPLNAVFMKAFFQHYFCSGTWGVLGVYLYLIEKKEKFKNFWTGLFLSSNYQKWLPYQILCGKTFKSIHKTVIWSTKLNIPLWVRMPVSDIYIIIEKLSFKKYRHFWYNC